MTRVNHRRGGGDKPDMGEPQWGWGGGAGVT